MAVTYYRAIIIGIYTVFPNGEVREFDKNGGIQAPPRNNGDCV